MKDKQFLMIPGPTPVPETVLLAMARQPIGHRSKEFSTALREVFENLKWVFGTKQEVFIFSASGTGAMEAAIYNLVNSGDKVLSLAMGVFGERWAKIAEMRGALVERITVPAGNAINPNVLREKLAQDKNKEIKFVTLTHNETSTGVTNPLKELIEIIKEHGALSIVDAITSVGAMPLKTDEWGVDVVVSGSQKGFMIPPGLAFLTCSEKAWKVHENCKNPSFYFNLAAHKKNSLQDTTPYTAAVNLILGLQESLKMMKEEGLESIYSRHAKISGGLRAAVKAMGLKPLVEDDAIASKAITSILAPENVTVADIRKGLKDDFDIVVADGQGELKGKIFRIGNLGFVSERDMIGTVGALELTLKKLGYKNEVGKGVEALLKSFLNK